MRSTKFSRYYRLLFALVGWSAMLLIWTMAVLERPPGSSALVELARSLRFFTTQTNLFVLLWYSAALLFWQRDWAKVLLQPVVKGAFTLYITVTFIIFFIVLQPLANPEGVYVYTNAIVHYVTPIAFIIDWILFEKKRIYQWRYALIWLVYPIAYLVFALTYGSLTGDAIYPFLNVTALGLNGLATWIAILTGVFLVLGLIYVGANRFWPRGNYVLLSANPGDSDALGDP